MVSTKRDGWRGDGPPTAEIVGSRRGASPHTRGWTRGTVGRSSPRRCFPAHAGMGWMAPWMAPLGADDFLLCLPLRFRLASGRRNAIPCTRGRRESFAGFLCRVEERVQHLECIVR